MLDLLISLDHKAFLFFNAGIANRVFDAFFLAITNSRNWIVPGIVFAALYVWMKRRESVGGLVCAALSFALTDSITYRLLKPLFGRHRPCHPEWFIEGGRFLLGYNHFLSFPSNHVANAFGLATLFTLMFPKRWYWYFPTAVLIAFSRIYVGMHWPADALAGAAFGAATGAAVFYACRWTVQILQKRREPGKNTEKEDLPDQ